MTIARPIAAVVICLAAAFAVPAHAATSWSTPAGSSDTITYSGGQTQNGLLTASSPTVGQDKFLFVPQNFSATDNQTTNDTASFLVTAKAGREIKRVSADLFGDYSVFGAAGTVDAFGTLTLTNTLTNAMISRTFSFAGLPATDGDAKFSDSVITLPLGWKSAQVSLSAGLTATAEPGTTSFIQFKGASVGIETAPQAAAVPLPPAVLAAIPGVLVAYLARRRMVKA